MFEWEMCWKFFPVHLIDGTRSEVFSHLMRRVAPDGTLQYRRPSDKEEEDDWLDSRAW